MVKCGADSIIDLANRGCTYLWCRMLQHLVTVSMVQTHSYLLQSFISII